MLQLRSTGELSAWQACPVCAITRSTSAAFDLLVGLYVGCVFNMKHLVTMLSDMQACPVCATTRSTSAAFDLLVGLCVGCVFNMKHLQCSVTLYYSEKDGLPRLKRSKVVLQ